MIDEELYQKAADELESDHRRPHIWARACALANDDHDEARYLYTNLRVEELLADQARSAEVLATPAVAHPAALDDLALEPVELPSLDESEDPAAASARSGIDARSSSPAGSMNDESDEGLIRPVGEPDRVKLELDENDTLDLDPVDLNSVESVDVEHVEDDSDLDGTVPHLSDPGTSADDLSPDDSSTISYHEADVERLERGNTDYADAEAIEVAESTEDTVSTLFQETDVDNESATGSLDDLGWLDEEYRAERRNLEGARSPVDDDLSDTFTREFERQAEELPGGAGGSVLGHEDNPPSDESALSMGLEDDVETRWSGVPDGTDLDNDSVLATVGGSGVLAATTGALASRDLQADDADSYAGQPADQNLDEVVYSTYVDPPLELADRRGRTEFAVYERLESERRAVRQGGSWLAMLVTLPWLLIRGLFGIAIVYSLLAAVVYCGLMITGQAWMNAGDSVTLATRAATIGFGLLAFVGLLVVPFARAQNWREDKLERKGFELVAYVRARSPGKAIAVLDRFNNSTSTLSR